MDQKSPEAFRTISEVADWLGVPTHVLRFWESRFSQVKPVKRAGGRRYYRPSDMELLGGIRQLLHEDGMTIRGVQKLLREKGVKHVAAMSPALDIAADTKDATPDNVVDLSDRRDTASSPEEAAPTASEAGESEDSKPWYESGVFAQNSEPPPAAETTEPDAEPEPVVEPEPEPTPEPEPATGVEEPPVAAEPEQPAEPVEEPASPAVADTTDPIPEPETMDFLAHEAAPETFETEDDAVAPDPAPPVETDPTDPMSSPEALDFAAHDAAPETFEPETPPVAAEAPEAPAAPADLVMPEIGPDPEDTDIDEASPLAAQLREARRARVELNVATLQALADRLDEIAGRMAAGPGASGGV